MTDQPQPKRAVVIGGSITGLLSAKVLSEFFDEVLIVERDTIENRAADRKGVPQSPQPHILLAQGYRILAQFFPGLGDDLQAAGAVPVDWGQDFSYFSFGGWSASHPTRTELQSFSCTRPLLETVVRQHVERISSVKRLSPYRVEALTGSSEHITGVRCTHRSDRGDQKVLTADLVIDASGRSTNAAKWLADFMTQPLTVDTVDAGLGYATGRYRLPDDWQASWKVLLIGHAPPENNRLGYLAQVENNELIATLGGYCRDYPPLAQADFLKAAQALPSQEFYQAIAHCTPTSEIKAYRSTANKRHRYDQLKQMPAGFVALGDAVCALCPAYGQGLTTSAMSAMVLQGWLAKSWPTQAVKHTQSLNSLAFQKQLAKTIKPAWAVATKSDSGFDTVKGKLHSTVLDRVLNGYMQRLIKKSHTDSELNLTLAKISHMVGSPSELFSPRLLMKLI